MNKKPPPAANPYLGLYIASAVLAIGGWTGLYLLVTSLIPTAIPRWLFFVLWLVALTGSAIPFMRYLNRRFGRQPASATVLLRRATWVGIYGATMAWLQIGRSLNWATGLLAAIGLVAVEWFVELREHSRWRPEAADDE